MSEISNRLREAREKKGLNQSAFGELGGVSRNAQFNYENAKRAPDTDYLENLAGHGIDIAYIVTGQASSASLSEEGSKLLIAFDRLGSDWRIMISDMVEKLTADLAAK